VVRLTEGRTYHLAVAGGVHALLRRGATVSSPQCSWSPDGASAQVLAVQAESADTKAINTVGSFVSPYTGSVHIGCTGWGAVFVDDADSAGGDTAGVFLLGGVVALTLGLVLALAAARELMTVRNGAD
jgi:hypothetical protein